MKKAFFIKAGVSAGLAIALSAPLAWALSVSPARTELRLPSGGQTRAVITVTNPHPEPYDVEISEKPWFVLAENEKIQVTDWLLLPKKTRFRLKPGKSRDIEITVRCPKDAVGELMGMVSFTYQGVQASMITPMISTAVYLDVEGTEKNLGEIVALGAGTRNGRFQIGTQVKATGNIRLRPIGSIRILDEKETLISEYSVPEAQPIFPGQTRDCVGQGLESPPPAGHYKLQAIIHSGSLEMKSERGILVKANGDIELDKEASKS
jgi:hypothetical protein